VIFIRLDENISHKIGEAAELLRIPGQPTFETPAQLNELGLADEHWMILFGRRGRSKDRRIVISGDDFTGPERATAELNKITVFYTPKMYWRPLGHLGQAAYILRWLPVMIEIAKTHPAGAQFQLPRSFNTSVAPTLLESVLTKIVKRSGRPRRPRQLAPAPLLDHKL
jgi:hypothetical protein